MTPALTFFVGLGMLVLFGWYFASDQGPRKRLLATTLMLLLVIFSIVAIWPPEKKIALGLDIQGGTSFLIRLVPGDKPIFFFQAEDGIRDDLVTGVQTCALPICPGSRSPRAAAGPALR